MRTTERFALLIDDPRGGYLNAKGQPTSCLRSIWTASSRTVATTRAHEAGIVAKVVPAPRYGRAVTVRPADKKEAA